MGCSIKRIIQLSNAINYIPIKITDDLNKDISNNCSYSWSTDGVCWTGWSTYSEYNTIVSNIETDFYLRILLTGSFGKLFLGDVATTCYNISIDSSNVFLKDFCGESNLFQPYNNLDCALQLQTQMSDSIVCMFGIPVYYIRVEPNEESADYTFKEYVLHNVVDIKQIKLMIPDGQMPSSNPKLTEFDFDWETDWETEISKTQFARAFGDAAFPKQRDFVYIPMMKRMWEVNSAYDEKNEGLMWRSTTWKLALVKFNDSTNVNGNQFEDVIDNWVVNKYEDLFGNVEKNEQERQTASGQITAPVAVATNLYNIFMEDAVRKQYTKQGVTILEKQFSHRSNIVARNIYKFNNYDNHEGEVIYQKGICGEEGTVSFILETPGKFDKTIEEKNIITFGEVDIKMKYESDKFILGFNNLKCELKPFTTYMIILKWNRNNFITELNAYEYLHDEKVPAYMLRTGMYWFDFEHPISSSGPYNNDYIMTKPMDCKIHAWPIFLTNIKYYNRYLNNEEAIKESIKYTTNHEACVINDLARPIDSGHGYTVK